MSDTTILLIDDDDVDRQAVQRKLRHGDWKVLAVASAGEALEVLKQDRKEPVECILLDYRLPDSDGLELLRKVKAYGIPIIMLTGDGNEQVAVEAMREGAQDYLSKNGLTQERLERSLLNAMEQAALKRALDDRLAEQEAFAMVVSHDLQNPMTSLGLLMSVIRDSADSGDLETLNEFTQQGEQLISRLSGMIRNLHQYTVAGRQEAPMVPVPLNAVFSDIRENLMGLISETSALVEVEDNLPFVNGDPTALHQLFENLIGNALKYRRPDVPPRIMVRREASDPGQCHVSILDNGIGIPPEVAEDVFKPFFRVRNSDANGSGLGLSLCARIVKQHEGRIWVTPAGESGSVFHVELPLPA